MMCAAAVYFDVQYPVFPKIFAERKPFDFSFSR
jgi:hypothetical protein